jgi:L,D-transpeptidase catalytic domain
MSRTGICARIAYTTAPMRSLRSIGPLVLVVLLSLGSACKRKPADGKGNKNPDPTVGNVPEPGGPLARKGPHKSRRAKRKCGVPKAEVAEPMPTDLPNIKERLPQFARTLKVMRKLTVRRKPSREGAPEGEIKRYSRLALAPYVTGRDGCRKYWLRVSPRGWVCGDYLQADRRGPLMRTQPIMKPGRFLPGRYAWVRKGGAKLYPNRQAAADDKPSGKIAAGFIVRWKKTVSLKGVAYWQNSKHYLIKAERLLRHRPSDFQGADLRALDFDLPVAIVRAKRKGAAVYDRPGGKILERAAHHSVLEIFESKRIQEPKKKLRTKFYRIGKGRWIRARRVISAWPTPKVPPGLKPCERWIEIVVDHQSLVAYEGTEPVYVTMITSGDKRHPTKYGIFRSWWKKSQTDMTSSMAGAEQYRVDDVPWAQFFYLGQALHGAYWHSDWGNRRSHGCINLAPKDAKWLYDWTLPHVPDGWLSRYADEKHPGTIVRVRHKVDHEVPFLRYSRKLAPPEAVKRLDAAYQERMRQKTIRMMQLRNKK